MDERETLLWQLGVAASLLDIVIAGLTDKEAMRPPAAGAWSVRLDDGGVWRADWADDEPDPAPPTTVAWLLWHIGWGRGDRAHPALPGPLEHRRRRDECDRLRLDAAG